MPGRPDSPGGPEGPPAPAGRIRVVIAKPGLDGHDKGAKLVARALMEAGMEVIYLGLRQTAEQIVAAAVQEDADVIGLSILSGAHMGLTRKVLAAMREKGIGDRLLVVGGAIPRDDVPALRAMGTGAVFPEGTPLAEIVRALQRWKESGHVQPVQR